MPSNHASPPARYLSPRLVITFAVLLGISAVIFSTLLAMQTRWIGVEFAPDTQGLKVVSLHSRGPAYPLLLPGDHITAIGAPDAAPFPLRPVDIMEDPYDLQRYDEFRTFFKRQSAIYQRLDQPVSHLLLADGRQVSFTTAERRPLASLPFLFWFQLGCGFVSLLIGVSVFAFRQDEIAPRCFALSAIGLMTIISAAAVYSTRELAIDGELFYRLTLLNQYGTVLFVSLGTAVLWYSPRRLSPLPMASILFALYSLFALLHTLQVWDSLNIGIRFPIFFFVFLIVAFSLVSWRTTRGRPASRAALKWLLYTWFTGIVLFLGLRLIPVALGYGTLIPQAAAWLVLVFIYVGVALGITRYRLFNLDRWVLKAWFWIFSGLAVVALDITFMSLLNIDTPLATAISLAIIGWVYFPLRQVLWTRFAPGLRRVDFESLFPEILEMTLSPGADHELFDKWRNLLQRAYKPLEIRPLSPQEASGVNQAKIIRNGIGLQLPALPGGGALELSGAEHAERLFNPNDVRFASAVWGLFNHAVQFRLALEQGAHEERQRIARDLHDDVAARLLTLVHRANDAGYEKLARQALSALRDTIYTLGTQEPQALGNLLADMRHEIQQRTEVIDIQLDWKTTGAMDELYLNPRQHINLQRIMQELVSNVISHAQADRLSVHIDIEPKQLSVNVCDNGINGYRSDWTPGKGLNNIQNRIGELKGTVSWQAARPQGCCVHFSFPL
ncbi:MAG TPA: hypothetical protein ENI97_03920 [Gammaproteobacteria bacterium]|nr:hypothetical protein [Gammaproteobacteria bacterium]